MTDARRTSGPGRRGGLGLLLLVLCIAGCGPKKSASGKRVEDPVRAYQMGVEYLRAGMPDRAAQSLEEAVRLEPGNAIMSYSLGLAYLGMKDYPAAEKTFLRVLEIDPFFTDAYNNLGIVYGELKDVERAKMAFERVLADARYRTPEVARFNIGALLAGQGRYGEALPYLRQAAQAKPENGAWRMQHGVALERVERYADAKTELEAVIAQRPDSVDGLFHLGYVNMRLGNRVKARECFRKVQDSAPQSTMGEESARYLRELGN